MLKLSCIARHCEDTVKDFMISTAAKFWNNKVIHTTNYTVLTKLHVLLVKVWWYTNISARASKLELGFACIVLGNNDSSLSSLVPQWCNCLQVNYYLVN